MKEVIYIISDKQYGFSIKATTDRTKAYAEAERMNTKENTSRYHVTVIQAF